MTKLKYLGCALEKLLFSQLDLLQKKKLNRKFRIGRPYITDFFPMSYCSLAHPSTERGWGGGGTGVAHLPLFSLFHHGGPPSLNHHHVRLLLHHWLAVTISRLWLTIPRLWLTIPPGRRAVAPWRRGRALLAVRGWVGWLKNKIMIWLEHVFIVLIYNWDWAEVLSLRSTFSFKIMCIILFLLLWERSIRIFSGMYFLFVLSNLAWSMFLF